EQRESSVFIQRTGTRAFGNGCRNQNYRNKCRNPAGLNFHRVKRATCLRKIQQLSSDAAIWKIGTMKITKNIGMLLLAVYLIIDGLLGFGLNLGPAIFLLYVVALAAGIFILIGK